MIMNAKEIMNASPDSEAIVFLRLNSQLVEVSAPVIILARRHYYQHNS